ncbi:DNA-directed RNA polymerase II core subunit [Lecanora helva]
MPSPTKGSRNQRSLSGSLSPAEPAKFIIPTGEPNIQTGSLNLGGATHISNHSHMTRPSQPFATKTHPGSGQRSEPKDTDNTEPRFELFLLGEGEKKVTEQPDTRIPSSSIFTFNKEDHTLGNMLRSRLLQSPHVTFSGYKVPHPLVSKFELRVQTDGTLTPRAALMQTCKDLINDLNILSREFTKEWELRKMVGDSAKTDDKRGDRNGGR